eukprot:COSAG05_NODE_766_length_7469_cov_7.800543_4_plen_60_part_00
MNLDPCSHPEIFLCSHAPNTAVASCGASPRRAGLAGSRAGRKTLEGTMGVCEAPIVTVN